MKQKKWLGSGTCDICGTIDKDFFVDGRFKASSTWALMCSKCWSTKGCGQLGLGHGQKYDAKTKEKLEG
jgi:hypothetical protein